MIDGRIHAHITLMDEKTAYDAPGYKGRGISRRQLDRLMKHYGAAAGIPETLLTQSPPGPAGHCLLTRQYQADGQKGTVAAHGKQAENRRVLLRKTGRVFIVVQLPYYLRKLLNP